MIIIVTMIIIVMIIIVMIIIVMIIIMSIVMIIIMSMIMTSIVIGWIERACSLGSEAAMLNCFLQVKLEVLGEHTHDYDGFDVLNFFNSSKELSKRLQC